MIKAVGGSPSDAARNSDVLDMPALIEVAYARPGCYQVVLKDRKGFVKIAMESGAEMIYTTSRKILLYHSKTRENMCRRQSTINEWSWIFSVFICTHSS